MRFRSFPKIPSHRSAPPRAMGGPWVALEKMHGAQLVLGVQGGSAGSVRVGKRKAWLDEREPFFGWQLLAGELTASARAVAGALGAAQIAIYGELIGGAYPHPDVAAIPGLSAVQSGIWYTPALAWIAFDILVAKDDDDEGELLSHREVEQLAAASGLRVPPRLARGTRAELEQVPVRFVSRVPALLGLPPLPVDVSAGLGENFAEGVVLKPDQRCAPSARPVIKRKLPELDDDRFSEAEAWAPSWLDEAALTSWVERLVQPARLASARSKVGEGAAAILDEVALDVAVDLGLAFRASWDGLDEAGQARVLERARQLARQLLPR